MVHFESLQFLLQKLAQMPTPEFNEQKLVFLEDIIDSHCFRSIYYSRVHATGFESYQGSFQEFFEQLFSPFAIDTSSDNLPIIRKLEDLLKNRPFNAGFGIYIYL